jgi:hypothetical protein
MVGSVRARGKARCTLNTFVYSRVARQRRASTDDIAGAKAPGPGFLFRKIVPPSDILPRGFLSPPKLPSLTPATP